MQHTEIDSAEATVTRVTARQRMSRLWGAVRRLNPTSVIVALTIVTAVTLLSVITPLASAVYGVPLFLAFPLAIVHVSALPLAVRRPALGSALSIAAALALQWLDDVPESASWPWWVVLIISQTLVFFLVAFRGRWRLAAVAWVTSVFASAVLAVVARPDFIDASSLNLVVFASVSGGALVIGIVLSEWNEIREQLLQERQISVEEYSRRMLAEERAKIARELHDVIAHGLSIINVQATTARYRNPGLDDASAREFDEIAASSRQALGEMRGLLGVLRDDKPSARNPQPRLSDVPDLVAQAGRAGLDITLDWLTPEQMNDVTDVVGLAAYRIVQEALSNAIRHAPGSTVEVRGSRGDGSLVITIANTAADTPHTVSHSGGFGHIGMAERAASVAGTVTMGQNSDGGFIVYAVLPMRGADYGSSSLS